MEEILERISQDQKMCLALEVLSTSENSDDVFRAFDDICDAFTKSPKGQCYFDDVYDRLHDRIFTDDPRYQLHFYPPDYEDLEAAMPAALFTVFEVIGYYFAGAIMQDLFALRGNCSLILRAIQERKAKCLH